MKLKDIADIRIGYQHRDRSTPISKTSVGDYHIIQIKDLDPEGRFRDLVLEQGGIEPYVWLQNLHRVNISGNPDRHSVFQGDVIFLSRGPRTIAVPLLAPLENTLISNFFYRLRFDRQQIQPEYLAWAINHPQSQKFLKREQRGTVTKLIPKPMLEALPIHLPPLDIQQKIVKIERLRQREAYLMRQLVRKRQKLTAELSFHLIRNHSS